MEFALVLRELARRRLLLGVGVLLAAIAAVFSVYRLDGSSLKARSLQYSSASTQVLVDSPSSVLGNLKQSFEPLSARAVVYANFMASPAVLNLIGRQVGLSGEQIYAAGPVNVQQPRVVQEPTALKRNVQITGETNPYRLNFDSQANLPTINIYSQAPTTGQAIALANAAVAGLQQYVSGLESSNKIPQEARVQIRQLGRANGGVVNGGISKALAALVFVAVLVLWSVLLLVGLRFRDYWRASAALQGHHGAAHEGRQLQAQADVLHGDLHASHADLQHGDLDGPQADLHVPSASGSHGAGHRDRPSFAEVDPLEALSEEDRLSAPTQSVR